MIDTIKPMGMDLAKKLHGHVRVELRDRWTGRIVDSREKDNLVTNAVLQQAYSVAWAAGPNSAMGNFWTPLFSKALGGVILFDGALTESASNIQLPSGAKIVAQAGQGSDTVDSWGGSYNAAESGFTSNGFTTVWDFLTSQANGTIAALSRTSHLFNSNPVYYYVSNITFHYDTGMSGGLTNSYIFLGYDPTNKYIYLAPTTNQTIDGVSLLSNTIYRVKQDLTKICLINGMPPASQMYAFKTLSASDGTTSARDWTYDPYNNEFVYVTGTTLHVIASDGTHSTKTISGTSGSGFAVTKTYYWRGTGSTIYRITKTNTADIQSISATSNALCPMGDDLIAGWSSGASSVKIIYPDGTVMSRGASPAMQGAYSTRDVGPFFAQNWLTDLYLKTGYLGTIANLDNPVTKSSSQTMKITYTLTEA